MKLPIVLFLLIILSSCSVTQNFSNTSFQGLGEIREKDYVDFLAESGKSYLSFEYTEVVKLNTQSIDFLTSIYERIAKNNQIFINPEVLPKFFIIKNSTPFVFSLPKSQFFFSTGIILKYLKSEELFVAALAAEMLKSSKYIYEKKIFLPLGYYSTEKMIQLTRVKSETRNQINQWTYFILKRAGYDASAYLNWIQIQNRNTLDFSMYLGDSLGISKEEYQFKNFMTKQGAVGVERKFLESNSSKDFYQFIKQIERK